MAHGTNRLNVCYNCDQYILVSRFDRNPICPNCNKESKQTSKEELRQKYWIGGVLYNWNGSFTNWRKITEGKR